MSLLKIAFPSEKITIKAGVSKRGNDYSLRLQHGLVTLPSGEIRKVEISLGDERPPFPANKAMTFDVGKVIAVSAYGKFEVDSRAVVDAIA